MAHQHAPTIPTRPKAVANICRCDRKIVFVGDRWVPTTKGVPVRVEPGSLGDRVLKSFFGEEAGS